MVRSASVLLPLVLLAGAGLASEGLARADRTRHVRAVDQALLFLPEADQLKSVASGFEEPLADLLWLRTVILFGERFDDDPSGPWTEWLGRMVLAVNTLDPRWRTAYFYGGSILRVAGDIDRADAVFEEARKNLPLDPYFPFSLGMNAYLYRDDPAAAGLLIAEAAALPGSPPWYASAAAAMQQEGGQRAAGIRYLEEVRATTESPAIRAEAERQLARLRHNQLVDGWAGACRAFREANGRPLASLEEFATLGFPLPENPRGDDWIVGTDGIVRSAGADAERYRKLLRAEYRHLR